MPGLEGVRVFREITRLEAAQLGGNSAARLEECNTWEQQRAPYLDVPLAEPLCTSQGEGKIIERERM